VELRERGTVNIVGTFHMVVQANAEVSIEEFLRKHTEYLAEPTNGDGVVVVMIPKSFEVLQKGVKTPIWQEEEKSEEQADPIPTEKTTVRECRTCGDDKCGMLAGSCAKWKPRQ
jgi:hypothetical protein